MKKGLKIAVSLLLVLAMLFSMTGCGEGRKAKAAFNNLMTALKALELDEAQKYMSLDEVQLENGESLLGDGKIFMENLFGKLEWEIVSSEKIADKTVLVTAKITSLDMKPILAEFFTQALQYAFANALADPQPTEEETNAKLGEILAGIVSAEGRATVTHEVTVNVIESEGGWRVVSNDDFVDALFGGLEAAVEELEKSYSLE